MAIIKCPYCGQPVSDKARECVHCGYVLKRESSTRRCPECGAEVSKNVSICPNCGGPMPAEKPARQPEKKKKHAGLQVMAVLVIIFVLISLAFYIMTGKGLGKTLVDDKRTEDCYEVIRNIGTAMETVGEPLDECSMLMCDVWKNALFNTDDPATDPFTKVNGEFVEDFNDALEALYDDEKFAEKLTIINEQQMLLRQYRRDLEAIDPPEDLQDLRSAVLRLTDAFVEYSRLVLNPSGSYMDITEKMNALNEELSELSLEFQSIQLP